MISIGIFQAHNSLAQIILAFVGPLGRKERQRQGRMERQGRWGHQEILDRKERKENVPWTPGIIGALDRKEMRGSA